MVSRNTDGPLLLLLRPWFQLSADCSLDARSQIHPNDTSGWMAVSDRRLQFPSVLQNPSERPPVRQRSQGSSFLRAEFAGISYKVPARERPFDTYQISHSDYGPGSALNQGDTVSLCGRTTADFPGLRASQDPIDVWGTDQETTEHSGLHELGKLRPVTCLAPGYPRPLAGVRESY
jgi:hypothetical protein